MQPNPPNVNLRIKRMTQLEKNLLAHKQKIHGNFLTMQNYLMRH